MTPDDITQLSFEQWAIDNPIRGETNLYRYPDGRYASPNTGIAWAAWQAAELRTLAQQQAPANLVPGVMHCAKCKFRLHRVTLYMGDGTTGAGDSKTEPCPNGCGPLWPITWEQEAREAMALVNTMHDQLQAAQQQGKAGGVYCYVAGLESATVDGWIHAKVTSEGEFTTPLYATPPALAPQPKDAK